MCVCVYIPSIYTSLRVSTTLEAKTQSYFLTPAGSNGCFSMVCAWKIIHTCWDVETRSDMYKRCFGAFSVAIARKAAYTYSWGAAFSIHRHFLCGSHWP